MRLISLTVPLSFLLTLPVQNMSALPIGHRPTPHAEIDRQQQEAVQPMLINGGFDQGLEGWDKADPKVFQVKTEDGTPYLAIQTDKRVELAQKITSLVQGQNYTLTFQTRNDTTKAARIILRNSADAKYLGAYFLASDAAWKTRSLKFTAPGPEVTLEISVRAAGLTEVDNFVVEKA